jgi:hypothetical protein
MPVAIIPILAVLALLAAVPASAQTQPWQGQLKDGRSVQVDPATRRATVPGPGGAATQLWDGVHRLENGSTITVRSGVVVPTQQMLEGPAPAPMPVTEAGPSPCLVLLRKTCGLHDECRSQDACGHAIQLLRIEQDERTEARNTGFYGSPQLETTRQCQEGLEDEDFFKACDQPQRGTVLTPCERLVDRACGPTGRCESALACGAARQALDAEYRERAASAYPDALTESSAQCNQALRDTEFFAPCQ